MTTILLVDDNDIQRKLCKAILEDAGYAVSTASSASEALREARAHVPDLIVSDVMMDEIDGFGLVRRLEDDARLATIPVLLVSAHFDDANARELAADLGAAGLVTRTPDFNAELRAISACENTRRKPRTATEAACYDAHERAASVAMHKLVDRAESAELQFRALYDGARDPISIVTNEGVIVDANGAWYTLSGFTREYMIGKHIRDFSPEGAAESNVEIFHRAKERGRTPPAPVICADGRTVWVEFSLSPLAEGLVLGIGRDVTDEIVADQQRAAAEERYRSLVERIPDVIWTCRLDGSIVLMTPNGEQLFGSTVAQMMADDLETRSRQIHPHDQARVRAAYAAYVEHGDTFDVEYRRLRPDGSMVWVRNRAIGRYERFGVTYVEGMISDITERKRLEESLRQAQKMEAIGRLTGGIAHDFNNILAVILANSHMLVEDLAAGDPRRCDAEEITTAAERAAALTRQLLAFSRHQILEPKIVDVTEHLDGLERLLRRLIGEDIELVVHHGAELGKVRVDVSQLEQVIMNLVVNARDAMPMGGKLSIETTNARLDREAATLVGSTAGDYVVISVTDNGCGMDRETKQRIFEPFFTTKEVGKGTGLGLATSYGIVKQSGGHIGVYSEIGQGSVFNIWLPRVDGQVEAAKRSPASALDGNETVLLVEDDERVRLSVARMLQRYGYKLLIARCPKEAIAIATAREEPIDLILSDVVMPSFSGPEVVDRVKERFAAIRTLYMSGYTDHSVLANRHLEAGANFIQKPFSAELLARKVRDVLA